MQPEHHKDLHSAALRQRGGQKRMAQLNTQERSALAKHAARARWHPLKPRQGGNVLRRLSTSSRKH